MNLPRASEALVERQKLLGYLLSTTHPEGRPKAELFARFGFTADNWELLQEALRRHGAGNAVVQEIGSVHGVRYIVEGPLDSPSGGAPMMRTVWILEGGTGAPRLVTAYPVRRRNAEGT